MKRILSAAAAAAMVVLTAAPALAGGGGHGKCLEPRTTGSGTTVDMKQMCFSPSLLTIRPGTTVTFTNYDEAPHSVTSTDGSGLDLKFDEGMLAVVRFTKAGVYRYNCFIHPFMTGEVRVGSTATRGSESGFTVQKISSLQDLALEAVRTAKQAPPVTTAAAAATKPASSKAGLGFLGLIPAAGLVLYGLVRHRRSAA